MKNRIKFIAYWLYMWAALCLAGIYWFSGIFALVVSVLLAGLFYQAGTGILKSRDRDRKISIGLLAFMSLSNLDTVISAISGAAKTDEALLVTLFSCIAMIVSAFGVYYLLRKDVANSFKQGEKA